MGICWDENKVRKRIYEKGLSFDQLAEVSGVKASTIYGVFCYNNGVRMETANRIAEGLGMNARELWTDNTKRAGRKPFPLNLIEVEFRRVALDLNKGQLAKLCAWNQDKITDIMHRGECTIKDAETLAAVFGTDVEELRFR